VGNVAAKVGALARPQDAGELETQRRQLLQAGYRSANALEVFNGLRVVLLLVLALTGFLLTRQAAAIYIALGVMAGAAAGYYLPGVWVRSALEGRQASLMRSFPDALDLLVSSVEAGLGLNPQSDGDLLRIPMPALTEERRKDLVKLAKKSGEECKIAIRKSRHEAKDMLDVDLNGILYPININHTVLLTT
jgi:hypothetical protein